MRTDAAHHGQAVAAGMPTIGRHSAETIAAPIEISAVVASGSSPRLIVALQPAWQAAANSTAAKTKGSTTDPGRPLPARSSARHAGTGWGGEPRHRALAPRASPNGDRRAWRGPALPYRPCLPRGSPPP